MTFDEKTGKWGNQTVDANGEANITPVATAAPPRTVSASIAPIDRTVNV